ncbi:MAG: hypothetical protein ACXADS_16635 [Candidatus Thorarchaeota archaeon]|jgi:hypothetical protein
MSETYKLGGDWGDAIDFFPKWEAGSPKQQVVGWKDRIPVAGDILNVPMQSGKVLAFEFTKVTRPGSPDDMFFGEVQLIEETGDA